jgi:hypothetical protein
MNKEFIPYEQALELKELGFDEPCMAYYELNNKEVQVVGVNQRYNDPSLLTITDFCAPLYQQAFRWFREKYKFTYSIGKTNIAVIHYDMTTQLLQDNDSYEAAELAAIKWFIGVAKQK